MRRKTNDTLKTKPEHYDELVHSLPEKEREYDLSALDGATIIERAELLCKQIDAPDTRPIFDLDPGKSRILFLAALRNLKLGKISYAQLATMHILDSAIHTLHTDPYVYLPDFVIFSHQN